ncbi:MAG: hypothetical protein ACU84J_16470 [Gammaproteobacteria bacterium]
MKSYTYLLPRVLLHEFSFFSILFALSAIFSVSSFASSDANQGQPVSVTGELTVLHVDDLKNHHGKYIYTLKDKDDDQSFELSFEGQPPENLRSGSKIRVHGKAFGNQIVVGANADGANNIETIAFAGASIAGQQDTIVLMADFKDASVPCSVQNVEDLMFTDPSLKSLDDFYQKNSLGQISFAGQVAGPYQINYSSTGACDFYAWADAVEAKAAADGIDLSGFNRKVYVLPKNSCMADGIGTVGGNLTSQSWIFRCEVPSLYGHEIGHNLYMGHAASLLSEYGDHSDVMGLTNGWTHSNAPHKEQMGWLPQQQILPISQPGIYDISPLEEDPSTAVAAQILKIAKPDTNEYYYLSYRRAIDSFSSLESKYRDQTSIHQYKGDASPNNTYFHDALADGELFSDTANGITVTQISHTPDSATVEIQFDSNCTAGAPNLNISPTAQIGSAGMKLEYQVTLLNNDSRQCPQSTFDLALAADLPAELSGYFIPGNLTLSPGASGTATLSVTSSGTAPNGDYSATVQTQDSWNSMHNRSQIVTYTVQTDNQPPSTPSGISATEKRRQIDLSWTSSIDNVGVAGYTLWRNGIALVNVNGTSFSDTNVSSGSTYEYYVTAYDDMGNISTPSSSVTVTMGGGGSKGGGGSGGSGGGKGNKK